MKNNFLGALGLLALSFVGTLFIITTIINAAGNVTFSFTQEPPSLYAGTSDFTYILDISAANLTTDYELFYTYDLLDCSQATLLDKVPLMPFDGNLDSSTESFQVTITAANFNDAQQHTISFCTNDIVNTGYETTFKTFVIANQPPALLNITLESGTVGNQNYPIISNDINYVLESELGTIYDYFFIKYTATDNNQINSSGIDTGTTDSCCTIGGALTELSGGTATSKTYERGYYGLSELSTTFTNIFRIYASDNEANLISKDVLVKVLTTEDTTAPAINFTESLNGTVLTANVNPIFNFTFSATETETHIKEVTYSINGGSAQILSPIDSIFDEQSEDFTLALLKSIYLDQPNQTISFTVKDYYDNTTLQNFNFSITSSNDLTPPVLTFIESTNGIINDLNAGSVLRYRFNVTDAENNIVNARYSLNGNAEIPIAPSDGTNDSANEEYLLELTTADFIGQGEQTLVILGRDSIGNTTQEPNIFTITQYDDIEAPTIVFTKTSTGLVGKSFEYAGTVTDNYSNIQYIEYWFDGARADLVRITSGDFDNITEEFDQAFSDLPEGLHTFSIVPYDAANNSRSYDFNIDIDASSPSCTDSWYNIPTPNYSNYVEYLNIVCTDNREIVASTFNVYQFANGSIFSEEPILSPVDGNYGGSSETISFNFTLDLNQDLDGATQIILRAYDAAGNSSYDEDGVTIEYYDDTPPTLNLDPLTPNPNTDNTPFLTGSCADNRAFDTNTNIASIRYEINNGNYTDILPLDGVLDSKKESFSIELDVLAIGGHTITVECTDERGFITIESESVSIIPVDLNELAGQFRHEDSFLNHDFQDINDTSLIWGNNQLRLKEDITLTRSLIDSNNFGVPYPAFTSPAEVKPDPLNSDILWYSKLDEIGRYQISTNTYTILNTQAITGEVISRLTDYNLNVVDGKAILWITDEYRLFVIDTTNNTGIMKNLTTSGRSLAPDNRNRLGTYLNQSSGGFTPGNVNMVYVDLNGTLLNGGDDIVFERNISPTGFTSADAERIVFSPVANVLYVSHIGGKIYKFSDNATPLDDSDDIIGSYSGYFNVFSGMDFDKNGKFIFGTADAGGGLLYVVDNENNTPFNLSDDTVLQLNDPIDIGFSSIFQIDYLEGENNVGDQIFIGTENGSPYYLNFNNTYADRLDDTFIRLDMANGFRNRWVSIYNYDYNTIYAGVKADGFFKIDLDRGWVSSGQAVGVPQRPEKKIILDNFAVDADALPNISGSMAGLTLDNTTQNRFSNPLASVQDLFIPKVQAQSQPGITYYLSNDDGVTWREVSLNDVYQLSPTDYRVKFRIDMVPVNGQTPVLDKYVLNFAGYALPSQQQTVNSLSISAPNTNFAPSQNFNLSIRALDILGFTVPSYNQVVTLDLFTFPGSSQVDNLFNKTSATLVNGSVDISDLRISQAGQYRVNVNDGSLNAISNVVTVSQTIVPTLSLYADAYTIYAGEFATLRWNTNNLSVNSISPIVGSVVPNGAYSFSLDKTTTFTLTGSGAYGSLSASITITVLPKGDQSSSNPLSYTQNAPFTLSVKESRIVSLGEKVTISWDATGADEVYIDYLGKYVATKGSFEFYPTQDTNILITAYKGDTVLSELIEIKVREALLTTGNFLPGIPSITIPNLPLILGISGIITAVGLALSLIGNLFTAGPVRFTIDNLRNILQLVGILPYKKRQGFVFDSKTSKGVSLAVLNLYDKNLDDKLLATIISDFDGGYYEPFIGIGKYTINVNHNEHAFPTHKKRPAQLGVFDYYKGEILSVDSNQEKQAVIIPLDYLGTGEKLALNFFNRLSLILKRILVWLSLTVYPMFILSIVLAIYYPSLINNIVAAFYLVVVGIRVSKLLKLPSGKVLIVDENRDPIQNVVITLKNEIGELVAVEKTNKNGTVKFFVPKGAYTLSISTDSYVLSQKMGAINVINLPQSKTKILVLQKV